MSNNSDEEKHDHINPFVIERARGFIQLGMRGSSSLKEVEAETILFSFASELVLKGLGSKRGHDLIYLFDDLEEDRRDWLSNKYRKEFGIELRRDIERCRNLFTDLRYWHERQGMVADTPTAKRLAIFLFAAGKEAIHSRPDRIFTRSEWP